ncbi:MAG: hypothetical protein QHC67_08575 [Sphingobium sp.]|jgi:hypothetical protein|uniref:hypothetical protein n=1 Tax=Sphingobium sp. TaxID=1912891 RepID=UPI0029A12818|nr:hypothetical protein [Sphingobium sp.]MDX3909859.1 hypothetical protein [Sphingobium sp.]
MRKRRALVLTSESAGHPFRRGLPPHVLVMPKHDTPAKSDDQDWKLFGLSFAAFFTAFYSFIA